MVLDFESSSGFKSTDFFADVNSSSLHRSQVAIQATGGHILAVWGSEFHTRGDRYNYYFVSGYDRALGYELKR